MRKIDIYLGDLDGLEGLLDICKIMNYTRVLRGEKCNVLSIPEIINRLAGELRIGCIKIIYITCYLVNWCSDCDYCSMKLSYITNAGCQYSIK